jgi:hypothetical protein
MFILRTNESNFKNLGAIRLTPSHIANRISEAPLADNYLLVDTVFILLPVELYMLENLYSDYLLDHLTLNQNL